MSSYSLFPPLPSSAMRRAPRSAEHEMQTASYSTAERAVIGTVLSLLVFLAVMGNLLVVIAVCRHRLLRTTSNFLLVSLAVADLLVGMLVMTFAIYNDLHERWLLGQGLCEMWVATDIMCCTASILHLCVISLDRYLLVRCPFRYQRRMSAGKTAACIWVLWVVSALLAFLPVRVASRVPSPWAEHVRPGEVCSLDLTPSYAVLSSLVSFYLPCLALLLCYAKLFAFARYHGQQLRRTTVSPDTSRAGSKWPKSVRENRKATVTLGVILGAFLLCWLPFFIANPIAAFCQTCVPPLAFKLLIWLGYFNSCLNPIIYSLFNTQLRRAFQGLLCPWRPQEASLSSTISHVSFRPRRTTPTSPLGAP